MTRPQCHRATEEDVLGALYSYYHKIGRWLTIPHCKSGPSWIPNQATSIFDFIAIMKSWKRPRIDGVEIKVSRSDFRRDYDALKWRHYLPRCHCFWWCAPPGVIDPSDLTRPADECVGLLHYMEDTRTIRVAKKATRRDVDLEWLNSPMGAAIWYIVMWRLGDSLKLQVKYNDLKHQMQRAEDQNHELKARCLELLQDPAREAAQARTEIAKLLGGGTDE